MKFSLLTIVGLSATISCFMISAHTAPIPRKRKVEKKFQGSANVLPTPCNPDSSDSGRHLCGGDETGGGADEQPELINLDSSGTKTEGQPCYGGVAGGLCVDGLYCYIGGTTTVDNYNGGAFCCPEGEVPNNDSTCGSSVISSSGTKTEGQPCFGGVAGGLCKDGLYCYIKGTTTVDNANGGAFCCPEGKAPNNDSTCGEGGTRPPLPPSAAPGPGGWQKSTGADGMTYDASAYVLTTSCDKICGGFSGDSCYMPEWQGPASPACTDFCAKARSGGSYTIKGHDGEPVVVTNLAVGHCIGDSLNNSCGDSCGKTYVVYNKDSGSGGAGSYAIIMGIDGAAIPSFEMSELQYDIFRGTTQKGNRVKPTYYNVAEGPYVMPKFPPHVQ